MASPSLLNLLEHRINEWIAAQKRKDKMNTHGYEQNKPKNLRLADRDWPMRMRQWKDF